MMLGRLRAKILGLLTMVGLIVLLASSQESKNLPSSSAVRVISSEPCVLWNAHCHTLGVTCEGIPERQVQVREFELEKPVGAILLTTGGAGNTAYSANAQAVQTMETLLGVGYEVFEIVWQAGGGWGTGVRGEGLKRAMCGYAEVVRWISANAANKPEVMCAQGNSGGSFQIAYGLSVYGLEDVFDMVILTGGPPVSRTDVACFGTDDTALKAAVMPEGTRSWVGPLIDSLMGWQNNGDYCAKAAGPEEALRQLQATSLVSPIEPRDSSFPKTKVNFVNSEGDGTHANHQGRIYYEKITSPKAWYQILGRAHNIDGVEAGAKIIRELFLKECKEQ